MPISYIDRESNFRLEVVDSLTAEASGFLTSNTINRRLDGLKNAKLMSGKEISDEVKSRLGLYLPEDKVGGLIVPDGEDLLGRLALLEDVPSEIQAYHTAAHEGIHLLGPDSSEGEDLVWDRKYVSKSLGPLCSRMYLGDDGKIDEAEPFDPAEKIFWEAVTDYFAAKKTDEKYGEGSADKILRDENVGFMQRYWIEFLINQHPNPTELESTLKRALYLGDMNEFLRVSGGHLDNHNNPIYDTLAQYMREGEDTLDRGDGAGYNAALDKWMTTVKHHFENGGAYSLNMEHFWGTENLEDPTAGITTDIGEQTKTIIEEK